jgi:hypothetical protein
MSAPTIYRLTIKGYRGISSLEWYPRRGMNIILGDGDVGKTTVLDAISLLLSPTNPVTLSDAEYHLRNLTTGFMVEAVMHVPDDTLINQQSKPSWPWEWNGNAPVVPSLGEAAAAGEPVYVLRVSPVPVTLKRDPPRTGPSDPGARPEPHRCRAVVRHRAVSPAVAVAQRRNRPSSLA